MARFNPCPTREHSPTSERFPVNIYESNALGRVVDLDAAASELKGSATITNDNVRRQCVAEISAAALLDIAGSLRAIADEARAAMPEPFELVGEPIEGGDTPERGDDFLVVGDRVRIDGFGDIGVCEKFGASEGSAFAEVRYSDDALVKTWIENLVRVHDDEHEHDDDEHERGDEEHEPPVGGDGLAILEDRDELDDFTPPSALDLLKATEAKPKKKGGKK